MASLVQPSHIDRLFATLGARSSALDAAESLVPDTRNVDEEGEYPLTLKLRELIFLIKIF